MVLPHHKEIIDFFEEFRERLFMKGLYLVRLNEIDSDKYIGFVIVPVKGKAPVDMRFVTYNPDTKTIGLYFWAENNEDIAKIEKWVDRNVLILGYKVVRKVKEYDRNYNGYKFWIIITK